MMSTREIEFDELWTIQHNLGYIGNQLLKIRKRTKSVHIQEILIDENISSAIDKTLKVVEKVMDRKESNQD